ncbi:E3 SUMO-protein ligase NSE2, putative [Hepatocystis sp. ex Piliocolobus tephrosceles]|nr:E3 SUMO-protein ligase NSE2, putative [Hepatocystis sp. ex Piliocolobus tephrosceles]
MAEQDVENDPFQVKEEPHFKEIWDQLDVCDEGFTCSKEVLRYHHHLQKHLFNILFSIKHFRSDKLKVDKTFLDLVNKYVKVKPAEKQSNERCISRLTKTYLKNELNETIGDDDDNDVNDDNDEDDDLVLNETIGVFATKCPISQQPFEEPVTQRFSKNKNACVHTFEKSFILTLMKNRDTIDCPIAACQKKVYKNSLNPDYEFIHNSRFKSLIDKDNRFDFVS